MAVKAESTVKPAVGPPAIIMIAAWALARCHQHQNEPRQGSRQRVEDGPAPLDDLHQESGERLPGMLAPIWMTSLRLQWSDIGEAMKPSTRAIMVEAMATKRMSGSVKWVDVLPRRTASR